jgi:uncharacterized RDD family membrane protein YckC
MLIEAAGPAILAAISPTALLLAVLIVVICASPAWRPALAFLIVPEPTDTAFPGLQRMAAPQGPDDPGLYHRGGRPHRGYRWAGRADQEGLTPVEPMDGLRSMGKRITDPVEQLAERTAERVIDLVVRTLDVNALIQRVDLNAIVERVDVNKVVDQVDVDKILDQIDIDKILDQIDVDRLLAKVDLNQLLARLDVDAVVDRVDINGIVQRVDIDGIAMHTDIGAMIAHSSGGIAGDARDAARSQAVGLDEWIARWVARLLRRDPPAQRPHFGGAVSRFVAYVVDLGVSTGVFLLALAACSFAARIITGHSISWNRNDLLVTILYVAWLFVYFAYSWGASGKSLGMALLGVRVVAADGTEAGPRRAVIRTLAFPLSFLLLGLGFTGILFQRNRRALHDMIAGTAVVYAWDARAARLRYLHRPSPDPVPLVEVPSAEVPPVGASPVGVPVVEVPPVGVPVVEVPPGEAPVVEVPPVDVPPDRDTPADLA